MLGHLLPHLDRRSPFGQTQAPLEHVVPVGHRLLHLPQFLESLLRFLHDPEHEVRPFLQEVGRGVLKGFQQNLSKKVVVDFTVGVNP